MGILTLSALLNTLKTPVNGYQKRNKITIQFTLEPTGQMLREVKQGQMNGRVNINIEVGDLPAGTYVCTVKAGKMIATEKLIVR